MDFVVGQMNKNIKVTILDNDTQLHPPATTRGGRGRGQGISPPGRTRGRPAKNTLRGNSKEDDELPVPILRKRTHPHEDGAADTI